MLFQKEYFSSDKNLTSNDELNTETSDEESIAGNAPNIEQNLSSEEKTIHLLLEKTSSLMKLL